MISATGRISFNSAHDLADRHRHHLGIVSRRDALMRFADEDVLQRHRQRVGCASGLAQASVHLVLSSRAGLPE